MPAGCRGTTATLDGVPPTTIGPDTTVLQDRYAELTVRVGVDVQPGQDVLVYCRVEHAPMARAVAEHAYAAGARRVRVDYVDLVVRRSAIQHAPIDALGTAEPFELDEVRWLRERGAAVITLHGEPHPHLFDDLDPQRVAATTSKELEDAYTKALLSGDIPWTVVVAPNEGWARQVFGEPDLERLWQAVAIAARLDETDPVAAWRVHLDRLARRKQALDRRAFDALRFTGPGTDLTVGLIKGSKWLTPRSRTKSGQSFVVNLPTEEVYTSPDWRRADGKIASTRPLVMPGALVSGLRLWFEGGRIVKVDADEGAAHVRAELDRDERARYLGEVSIVDGTSAVRRAGVVFHETLLDENAGCHIAWGQSYPEALEASIDLGDEALWAAGLNTSMTHTDVVVGGPAVDVDGLTTEGASVPILRDDRWVLPLD